MAEGVFCGNENSRHFQPIVYMITMVECFSLLSSLHRYSFVKNKKNKKKRRNDNNKKIKIKDKG